MDSTAATTAIVDYYDNTVTAYNIVWRLANALGLHYGFWEQSTPSILTLLRHTPLIRAIQRQNALLAEWANIPLGARVLDAGCGVGGSSLYLAKELQCSVLGITLSAKQVAFAQQMTSSQTAEIASRLRFEVNDFTNTQYPAQSFDYVWAIESVCHAASKPAFCTEASRLLTDSGCLMVADYFATEESFASADQRLLDTWFKGWAIDHIATRHNFELALREAGFKNVEYWDVTDLILPSARRLNLFYHFTTKILRPIVVDLLRSNLWGLNTTVERRNIEAARCQYLALKRGLWRYGVFIARK